MRAVLLEKRRLSKRLPMDAGEPVEVSSLNVRNAVLHNLVVDDEEEDMSSYNYETTTGRSNITHHRLF